MKPNGNTTSIAYLQEAKCLLLQGDAWAAAQLAGAVITLPRDMPADALYGCICEQLRLEQIKVRYL